MRININAKNVRVSDHLRETIEKKVKKLGKYFSDDITADVKLTEEKGTRATEVTIKARDMIFRAEDKGEQFYDGIDNVVAKLSSQMGRFKDKLQSKHKYQKDFSFDEWPTEEPEEIVVAKSKKFDLEPMTVDEAVVQMEMLEHNFYVFLNMETDSVNVVYKRNDNGYGLLETAY